MTCMNRHMTMLVAVSVAAILVMGGVAAAQTDGAGSEVPETSLPTASTMASDMATGRILGSSVRSRIRRFFDDRALDSFGGDVPEQISAMRRVSPELQRRLAGIGVVSSEAQAFTLPPMLEEMLPTLEDEQRYILVEDDIMVIEDGEPPKVIDAAADVVTPTLVPTINRLPRDTP